jgi:hypothetical protein
MHLCLLPERLEMIVAKGVVAGANFVTEKVLWIA